VPDRPGYPVVRITPEGIRLTRHVFLVVRRGMLTWPAVQAMLEVIRRQAQDVAPLSP
jgi:hypothetical protein